MQALIEIIQEITCFSTFHIPEPFCGFGMLFYKNSSLISSINMIDKMSDEYHCTSFISRLLSDQS